MKSYVTHWRAHTVLYRMNGSTKWRYLIQDSTTWRYGASIWPNRKTKGRAQTFHANRLVVAGMYVPTHARHDYQTLFFFFFLKNYHIRTCINTYEIFKNFNGYLADDTWLNRKSMEKKSVCATRWNSKFIFHPRFSRKYSTKYRTVLLQAKRDIE